MHKLLFIITLQALLYGCATLDEGECKAGAWEAIGYNDGSKGKEATRLSKHVKACARFNIPPNRPLYMAGHQRGLEDFCTPELAFSRGKKDAGTHKVCPSSQFPHMLPAYDAGYEIFLDKQTLREEIRDIEYEIAPLSRQLEQYEHNLRNYRSDLREARRHRSDKDKKDKPNHREQRYLRREINSIETSISHISFQLRPYRAEIRALEHEIYQLNAIAMPARFRQKRH